ncbi:hypothetical protein FKM82_023149 [Ascaphus truei]
MEFCILSVQFVVVSDSKMCPCLSWIFMISFLILVSSFVDCSMTRMVRSKEHLLKIATHFLQKSGSLRPIVRLVFNTEALREDFLLVVV